MNFTAAEDYIHDPEHKKHPRGGGWHRTEMGWSQHKSETHPESSPNDFKSAMDGDKQAFQRLSPDQKATLVEHHNSNLETAITIRKKFIEKHGVHWFKKIQGPEKELWGRVTDIMVSSIQWARHTIGGEKWWNLPCVIKERESHRNEIETKSIFTAEREKLRNDIADKLYGNGSEQKDRKLFIVMGLPGAGKSAVVVNRIKSEQSALEVDADMVKEHLPEFNGGAGAGIVHKESAQIAEDRIFGRCRENGDNVIFPTVGKNGDKLVKHFDHWRRHGYSIHLSLVDIDLDSSIERALRRWVNTGRFVDPEYISQTGDAPKLSFEKVKTLADTFEHWSNEVPFGTPPKLLEKGSKSGKMANLTNRRNPAMLSSTGRRANMLEQDAPIAELDTDRMTNVMEYFDEIKRKLGKTKLSREEIYHYSSEFERMTANA